jgi:hypothetical protein
MLMGHKIVDSIRRQITKRPRKVLQVQGFGETKNVE